MAVKPVPGAKVYDFGVPNKNYRLGYHPGVDYASSNGSKIVATTDGRVMWLPGYNGGYGNVIALVLSNGDVVWHAHCKSVVRTGAVKKGQHIGYTNNTGWTTGPHCHISYRVKGNQNAVRNFDQWLRDHPEKAPARPTPKPAPKKRTLKLPAVPKWRVYPLNKSPVIGNEKGFLLPARYGGLTYSILGNPKPHVYTIKTASYGIVNIYAHPSTGAKVY